MTYYWVEMCDNEGNEWSPVRDITRNENCLWISHDPSEVLTETEAEERMAGLAGEYPDFMFRIQKVTVLVITTNPGEVTIKLLEDNKNQPSQAA